MITLATFVKKTISIYTLLLLAPLFINAQDLAIHDIFIKGNNHTKSSIILRELPFRSGEIFSKTEIPKLIKDAQEQLINTSLFHTVAVSQIPFDSSSVDVIVELKERWYIFPMPYLKLVDRNINQWLVENKGDLSRVNYGIKLKHNNFSGLNDKLRINLITGYTPQVSFSYNRLYIDRKLRWGFNSSFSTGKAREVNYNTIDNKQLFWKDSRFVRSFTSTNLAMTYRKALYSRHVFGVNFTSERVTDTVISLNPEYFKGGRKSIGYPVFYYSYEHQKLDYNAYPTVGTASRIQLSKSGLNKIINLWQVQMIGTRYFPLSKKSFLQTTAYGSIKLPFKQPWFAQRFLGYGDAFLQGYEYNVIDGVAGGFEKATFAHELVNLSLRCPHIRKRLVGERIPFRVYGKIYGNTGYVYNPQDRDNSLTNRILMSGGVGLDIVTIYDMVIKLEWSFNQLGQNGLFLHSKSVF